MFKFIAEEYVNFFSFLNLFSYITFRTGAAILTSLFFSLIFGQIIINKLSIIQPSGQPIRDDGPETHILKKQGTPTMGGLLIILSIIISIFLWSDLTNPFVIISLLTCFSFGVIGFYDDYIKIKNNSSNGLKARTRISIQIILTIFLN